MPDASYSHRTNTALRHARHLAELANRQNNLGYQKTCKLGCLWQLELAQRSLMQELLEATPLAAAMPANLSVEQLIEQLKDHDKAMPELNQLARLRLAHPALVLAAWVASSGNLPVASNHHHMIGSEQRTPTSKELLQACEQLDKLTEQARETCNEW